MEDKSPISNSQEEDLPSLSDFLRRMISKLVRQSRTKHQGQLEDAAVSPTSESKEKGRKVRNRMVWEENVMFSLPEECNAANIKDLDKVEAKLGKWRIESRERDTKMRDTYYFHYGSQKTFRSITEVVNFILPESYPKDPTRKKAKKGEGVAKLKKLKQNLSPDDDGNKVLMITHQAHDDHNKTVEEFFNEGHQNCEKVEKGDHGFEKCSSSQGEGHSHKKNKTIQEWFMECYDNLLDYNSWANERNNEQEMQVINTTTEAVDVTMTEIQEKGRSMERNSMLVKSSGAKDDDGKENLEVENNSLSLVSLMCHSPVLEVHTDPDEEMLLLPEPDFDLFDIHSQEKWGGNYEEAMQPNTTTETVEATMSEATEVQTSSINEEMAMVNYNNTNLPHLHYEANNQNEIMQVSTSATGTAEVSLTQVNEGGAKMEKCPQEHVGNSQVQNSIESNNDYEADLEQLFKDLDSMVVEPSKNNIGVENNEETCRHEDREDVPKDSVSTNFDQRELMNQQNTTPEIFYTPNLECSAELCEYYCMQPVCRFQKH